MEDCCGCPYNLHDEDDAFLKSMNKNASTQCSEDQFEEVMTFFEETAHAKQPFAAVDNPPVLALEEMENAWDDALDENARPFAKEIYPHWKGRRLRQGNKGLIPGLKVRDPSKSTFLRQCSDKCSWKLVRILTTVIHTSVSGGARCGKFGKLEGETLRAPRSSGN